MSYRMSFAFGVPAVTVRVGQRFTLADAERMLRALATNLGGRPATALLVDLTGAALISPPHEWAAIGALLHECSEFRAHAIAMLAASPGQCAAARAVSVQAEKAGVSMAAFRDREEAVAWLGAAITGASPASA